MCETTTKVSLKNLREDDQDSAKKARRSLMDPPLRNLYWQSRDIQPIPKPREPTNFKTVSFLSCTAKTAEKMVLYRFLWCVGELHPHVFGFSRGMSTAGCLTTQLAHTNNRPTVTVFLDLE